MNDRSTWKAAWNASPSAPRDTVLPLLDRYAAFVKRFVGRGIRRCRSREESRT